MSVSTNLNVSKIVDSPIDSLDTVLNYFSRTQSQSMRCYQIWFDLEKEGLQLSEADVLLVIKKLAKDEFVSIIQVGARNFYRITFEGLVFQQQGGYKQKLNKDTFLKRQEESNKRTQRILFWFTGIVAVGTFIAAVYYVLEILKFFHKL